MAYWVNGEPVSDYDWTNQLLLVDDTPGMEFALATTPKGAKDNKVDLRELGGTSLSPFLDWLRVDYNADLRGQAGLRNYDMMRRNDGTVRGTLRLIKTPVLSARWYVQPATQSVRDKNAAEFIENCLFKYMSTSFPQFLTEALLMLDYGYYPFEKVFRIDHPEAPGKVVWKKLAPRHPLDIFTWNYDDNGGPDGIEVPNPNQGMENVNVTIPIDKLIVFTFDKEAGNIEGMSVLRSAYKHWYYKEQLYKIDAIQKERHGIGIPIIILPPNFTNADRQIAENIGRNLRTSRESSSSRRGILPTSSATSSTSTRSRSSSTTTLVVSVILSSVLVALVSRLTGEPFRLLCETWSALASSYLMTRWRRPCARRWTSRSVIRRRRVS
jgi:hypothetical protein